MSTARKAALADMIDRMQDKMMVGAGGAKTRDDALELGELRPDYLFFGRFGYDNTAAPHHRNLSLGRWWAEMIQIPCIVLGGTTIESVEPVAATGVEFVALVERGLCRRRRCRCSDRPRQRIARPDRTAFRGLSLARRFLPLLLIAAGLASPAGAAPSTGEDGTNPAAHTDVTPSTRAPTEIVDPQRFGEPPAAAPDPASPLVTPPDAIGPPPTAPNTNGRRRRPRLMQ